MARASTPAAAGNRGAHPGLLGPKPSMRGPGVEGLCSAPHRAPEVNMPVPVRSAFMWVLSDRFLKTMDWVVRAVRQRGSVRRARQWSRAPRHLRARPRIRAHGRRLSRRIGCRCRSSGPRRMPESERFPGRAVPAQTGWRQRRHLRRYWQHGRRFPNGRQADGRCC